MAPREFLDFLKWSERYHADLRDEYETLGGEAQDPKVKALLGHISLHEHALGRLIHEYEESAPNTVLHAWFKVSPDLKSVTKPEAIRIDPDATVDEVIERVLKVDEDLLRVYKTLLNEALADEVKEAIQDLIDAEEREKLHTLRAANGPV